MTLEGILARLRNEYIRRTTTGRRKRITQDKFTIISNNCWGGLVYESYGLEKQSPTVGLYFMAEEYIKFLSNLKYYICDCEMTFIPPEQARHYDYYKTGSSFGSYPIARLGDVEIAMLHYHSEAEAKEKWERRCKKIHWDKLFIKMNDQNKCQAHHAEAFGRLPFEHKAFFTVKKFDAGDCTLRILRRGKSEMGGSQEPFGAHPRFNVNKIINSL